MDARFYNSEEIDIERLASDLVNAYIAQGYQAQQFGTKDQMLVQLKKGGDFEAILGMQAALSVTLQRTTGGVLAMIGQQKWLDKAAIGAVGIVALPVLWPLALTAGVGAIRQASLGNQVLNMVDGLVRQQRPSIVASPVPYHLLPQVQQQWTAPPYSPTPAYIPPSQVTVSPVPVSPPPALPAPTPVRDSTPPPTPKGLRCPHCNTPYEEGDTFCSGCGRSLITPRLYCSKCNSEVKQGASFCPKCGASTFHTLSAAQAMQQPRPAPVPPPVTYAQPTASPQPVTPVYTPPTPSTPVYTPPTPPTPVYTPPQPAIPVYTSPPTPVYTPPTAPTPVYTPPPTPVYTPSPTVEPYVAPTVAAPQLPATPPEPAYVPPVTQTPPVAPQPKVTLVPGSQTSKPSVTPPPPPRPQKVYYTPSNQAQPTPTVEQGQPTTEQATALESTLTAPIQQAVTHSITAKPSAQLASDRNVPWGRLTFDNGTQVQLTGERAVVGRYDHDLGGLRPEVDLGQMEGADTISRVHAAIEHIGSTYVLTDLNSTNATRLNGKRLEPDKATPLNDGDKLTFGKISCTFNKL